jgi:hypothetical protein
VTADYSEGVAFVEGDYCPVGEAKIPPLDRGFLRSDVKGANPRAGGEFRGFPSGLEM